MLTPGDQQAAKPYTQVSIEVLFQWDHNQPADYPATVLGVWQRVGGGGDFAFEY